MKPQTVPQVTPDLLLYAYARGAFPMGRGRNSDAVVWLMPEARGILPLDRLHVPKRLARLVRAEPFEVRVDTAFREVMLACAAPAAGREDSWINADIVEAYCELHRRGHAHSIECWRDGELVGGLYGVELGAAFFGESMFSRERDASKVALVHLAARLIHGGFELLDTQFMTAHLAQFGGIEIPCSEYLRRLGQALTRTADFYCPEPSGSSGNFSLAVASGEVGLTGAVDATVGACWPGWLVLQLITQTS